MGSVILSPPLPKFPTYSPRNPHFLIFMDVKSKEILWRGPSVLSRAVGMEGSPAASLHVCSPPSCAVQGGMWLSQVTAGDLAVLPRGDPGLEQPQLSLGVQGSCRAAFLLSLSCIFFN